MDNIFLQCTFYAQSFTHISLNVENRRNEKDNSDDNYVKKKDNPEKKIKFENYCSIFRHEFELLQIS